VRIDLPSGTPAELALPAGTPLRGVAMAPDLMGLRPLFDELCARLAAEEGWAVCAPEPFPGREDLTLEERRITVAEQRDDDRIGDLVAAADYLGSQGCERVAVMGFCMGGMYALKASGTGRFDRAVSFYGMIRVPESWKGPGHGEPLDLIGRSNTPVLAIIGGRDPYTPPEDVELLRAVGERTTVVVYPDAEHGFVHDPSRPAHRADDAADAWRRVREFLA
jgi:carboxymethylenebutenolidase